MIAAVLLLPLAVITILWRRSERRAEELQAALTRELKRGASQSIQGEGYRAHLHIVQ